MITSFQVVDGFCERIEQVRKSCLNSGFGKWAPNQGLVGSSKYDGMNFWGDHALMLQSLAAALAAPVFPNAMFFRNTNKETEKAYIHSDRHSGNHTCIVYLSEHGENTGTAFWRHKSTGLTYMPPFEVQKEQGIFEELKEDMVSGDPDKWEQLDYVRGVSNRALLFQAPLFHSRHPLGGFGEGAHGEDRLIWATHYFKLNASGGLY
jgi:hypothetical protein